MVCMKGNSWARLLAYGICNGAGEPGVALPDEYLAAENRIFRAHLPAQMRLSDPERRTLAEIGKWVGRKALERVACVAKPDTILAWYRRLIAREFAGSQSRTYPGRPRISARVEELVVRFARENSGGVTTASWERWPAWVIRFRVRLWATSCAATTSHQLPNGVKRRLGRSSVAGTWTCSQATSSRSKCTRGGAW